MLSDRQRYAIHIAVRYCFRPRSWFRPSWWLVQDDVRAALKDYDARRKARR